MRSLGRLLKQTHPTQPPPPLTERHTPPPHHSPPHQYSHRHYTPPHLVSRQPYCLIHICIFITYNIEQANNLVIWTHVCMCMYMWMCAWRAKDNGGKTQYLSLPKPSATNRIRHKINFKVEFNRFRLGFPPPRPVAIPSVKNLVCPTIYIFTNPSARAGYDTRSIFKRSLTGLNSEFSFS